MEKNNFREWLINNKCLSKNSASDILCRLKRVANILCTDKITQNTISQLIKSDVYIDSSLSVRSQLKRAINLYLEFIE